MRRFIILTLILWSSLSFSQDDSSRYLMVGSQVGYFNYNSIDEIFTPFIYSGNSIKYDIHLQKKSLKNIHEFNLGYSRIIRHPENVNIPEYYKPVSYDNGKEYLLSSEKAFREVYTFLYDFTYTFKLKTHLHLLNKDQIRFNFTSYTFLTYRGNTNDLEIFSTSLGIGYCYTYTILKDVELTWAPYFSLVSINIRKPYSGTVGQTYDELNSGFYADYIKNNNNLEFFNNSLNIQNRISIGKQIGKRFFVHTFYDFSYMNVKNPRKLVSVINNYGIGIHYKFLLNGKK